MILILICLPLLLLGDGPELVSRDELGDWVGVVCCGSTPDATLDAGVLGTPCSLL